MARTLRTAGGACALLLMVTALTACSQPAPPPPPPESDASSDGGPAASATGDSAATAPTWTPRKPSGRTDPSIVDEWNTPPARPAGVPSRCTQRGCTEEAVLRGSLAPGDAAVGEHTFVVLADGRPFTCRAEVASTSVTTHATCTGGATAYLGPKMRQVETKVEEMVAVTEAPMAGEHEWSVTVPGQPKRVRLTHRAGKRVVLEASAQLRYGPTWPNGPGCDPPCFKAAAELGPKAPASAGP